MKISRSLNIPSLPARSTCAALGLFNGLHLGHMAVLGKMLEQAKTHGLTPLVFTFTANKGNSPAAKDSMANLLSGPMMNSILEQMGVQQIVCPDFDEFRGLEPEQFVRDVLCGRLGVARVVCGYDFHFGKNAAGNTQSLGRWCAELGIAADVVPAVLVDGQPAATRRIRALVEQGDISAANRLLGRAFAIDFEVIHGRKLGRTLGWPTINQAFPGDFVIPRVGVYATITQVDGSRLSSVTNVGTKPTVGSDGILAETYIQGFSGDLYGKRVQVEFLQFLRAEQKFASLTALKEAISADATAAQQIASAMLKTEKER